MSVRVVTDSTADVPADLVEKLGIVVVPALISMGGQSYRDGVDITRAEFYQRLPSLDPLPTTGAPAPGVFEAAYRSCGDAEIVAIHLASKLSAIFNAARLGAEPLGSQVTLIDSEQISMGMGFQVLAAAEAAQQGCSRAEVIEAARSVQQRVRLFAALDTIEYLRRSGRASLLTATLGELLQIKPLLEIRRGEVITIAKLRTRGKARQNLLDRALAAGALERTAVVHVAEPEGAQQLVAQLAPHSATPPLVNEVTAAIGTHAGPGSLGIAAVVKA